MNNQNCQPARLTSPGRRWARSIRRADAGRTRSIPQLSFRPTRAASQQLSVLQLSLRPARPGDPWSPPDAPAGPLHADTRAGAQTETGRSTTGRPPRSVQVNGPRANEAHAAHPGPGSPTRRPASGRHPNRTARRTDPCGHPADDDLALAQESPPAAVPTFPAKPGRQHDRKSPIPPTTDGPVTASIPGSVSPGPCTPHRHPRFLPSPSRPARAIGQILLPPTPFRSRTRGLLDNQYQLPTQANRSNPVTPAHAQARVVTFRIDFDSFGIHQIP